MLALLRRRPTFRQLWVADSASLLGDWLSYVAIATLVVQQGEGWLALAMVLVLHSLPGMLASPLAGWLSDRMDRKRLMVASALARALVTGAMAVAAAHGQLVWLQVLLGVRVALGATEQTTGRAALRAVVSEDELQLANALSGATWSVIFAAGVALGGFVASWLGPVTAIALDGATYLLSALLLLRLPPLEVEVEDDGGGSAPGDWAALRFARERPQVLGLALGKTPIMIVNGGALVYLNRLADDLGALGTTAMAIGLLQAARATGTGVGPLLHRYADGGRWHGPGPMVIALATFAATAVFSQATSPALLILSAFVWGAGTGANWVFTTAGLLANSPDGLAGRLSAIDVVSASLGLCVGALLGASLGELTQSSALVVWGPLALGVTVWMGLRGLEAGAVRVSSPPA